MKKQMIVVMSWVALAGLSAQAYAQGTCEGRYEEEIASLRGDQDNLLRRQLDDGENEAYAALLFSVTGLAFEGGPVATTVGDVALGTSTSIHDAVKAKDLEKTLSLIQEAAVGSGLQFLETLNEVKSESPFETVDSAMLAQAIVQSESIGLFCGRQLSGYSEAVQMIKMILLAKVIE